MTDKMTTTGRIKVTLEIDWPHSFDQKATAADIYTTVARECENLLRSALREADVGHRIIGPIEPLMVVYPCKKT
ncbi:hypothetical protein LB543_05090 [Mesorhizobium sp. ESP7-2]|uniref:hypothetical protein n=1 Tax=Mesorhizobium sp. ESP7-2 TaxID=2876622 RepID=UPI001CCFD1A7|nr:hypothetical protein [Mesorhizobium sp. ESP7-2]MBZ9706094.1 hypothetical protein [Mesorhizobium sp. ESP7-2]